MDRKILITAIALLMTAPAFAELTVDDASSPAYLKNHGYSDTVIWATQKTKYDVNGEKWVQPDEEEKYNPFIRVCRKVFMYFDPALDNKTFFNNHNINSTTRYDDL